MSTIDQQFIEYIVKSLVGDPDSVSIERTIDEKGVLLKLTVSPDDLGRVIGKRGATAQSMRTLLRALGTKNDARYNLKIVDNGTPRESRQEESSSDSEPAKKVEEKPAETEPETEASGETVEEPVEETVEKTESLADKHRKELEELDDLDL